MRKIKNLQKSVFFHICEICPRENFDEYGTYVNKDIADCVTHSFLLSSLIIACMTGMVRLQNGSSPLEGRVEVCYDNDYGTVCDDKWDVLDARVVCAQVGDNSGSKYTM